MYVLHKEASTIPLYDNEITSAYLGSPFPNPKLTHESDTETTSTRTETATSSTSRRLPSHRNRRRNRIKGYIKKLFTGNRSQAETDIQKASRFSKINRSNLIGSTSLCNATSNDSFLEHKYTSLPLRLNSSRASEFIRHDSKNEINATRASSWSTHAPTSLRSNSVFISPPLPHPHQNRTLQAMLLPLSFTQSAGFREYLVMRNSSSNEAET